MAIYKNLQITEHFLDTNPDSYFVFGDNLERVGMGGAAKLRYHPQSLGFITKKFPDNNDSSFYRPDEYEPIFLKEITKLLKVIKTRPDKFFYISQLGGGLANRYNIWEIVIKNNLIKTFEKFNNVVFCWKE